MWALLLFFKRKKGCFVFVLMKGYSYYLQLSQLACLFKSKAACAGIRTTVPTPLSSNSKSLNRSWTRATFTIPYRPKSSAIQIQSLKQSATWKKVKTCFSLPQERNENIPSEGPCEIFWLVGRNHKQIHLCDTQLNILAGIRVHSPNFLWTPSCNWYPDHFHTE